MKKSNEIKVITMGIDPGLASTGYAVVERDGTPLEMGTLKTTPRTFNRLASIIKEVHARVAEYKVKYLRIEEYQFFARKGRPLSPKFMGVAKVQGACQAVPAFIPWKMRVKTFLPKSWQAVMWRTLYRPDEPDIKSQTRKLVEDILGQRFNEHESDALCIAWTRSIEQGEFKYAADFND